ncbi:MAG: ABC-type transport auxiliary lipoprotein family protein, partial [Neisseriaceae bacterium]
AIFSPIKQANMQKYLIKYNIKQQYCTNKNSYTIRIADTTADSPFNTNSILYSLSPYTLNQYSYSVWAALPQDTIGQALEQTVNGLCMFRNVDNTYFYTDYILISKIITLKEEINKNKANAILSIQVQLINNKNHLVKNKTFTETTPIKPSPENMTIGISKDLDQFLNELTIWLQRKIITPSTHL